MNYYYLLIPLLLSIVIIILILRLKKQGKVLAKVILEKHDIEVARKEEIKHYFEEEWNKEEKELDNRIRFKREGLKNEYMKMDSDFKLKESEVIGKLKNLQIQLNEKEKRYVEVNQDLDLYREGKMKEIDSAAAEYEQRKRLENAKAIEEHNNSMKKASAELQEQLQRTEEVLRNKLEETKAELEVERSKRAAINEEIRRQKEVEMKQDFYRIQFDEEDKNDVEILRSIAPRLRHPEAINKVIWSAYYQKPLTELRKRLLPNGDKSGIYKITRLKTGEIYIGSTTSFDTRFVNHYKTALGVGTLASSQLHRTMREDGPEHFTVEILEEDIPKEKLKEKESYYIDFYDSKNYGLNTIKGEQK